MKKHNVMGHTMIMLKDLGFVISEARKAGPPFDGPEKESWNEALDYIVRQCFIEELRAAETEEEKEAVVLEIPGSFAVYKSNGNGRGAVFFERWNGPGNAIITDKAWKAFDFKYESKAEEVAKELGEGWEVINYCPAAVEKTNRLLDAIFGEKE